MSPAVLSALATGYSENSDHRLYRRYPIRLPVEYKLKAGPTASQGAGITREISSGGVAFEANASFTVGERIELRIQWPCLLDGLCPLILHMSGRIVRTQDKLIAVETTHHEFRTAGVQLSKVNDAVAT